MSKTSIGILFILAGLAYGSLGFGKVNEATLGFLVKNKWIKSPVFGEMDKDWLGPKLTIYLYSAILITIGIFMIASPE